MIFYVALIILGVVLILTHNSVSAGVMSIALGGIVLLVSFINNRGENSKEAKERRERELARREENNKQLEEKRRSEELAKIEKNNILDAAKASDLKMIRKLPCVEVLLNQRKSQDPSPVTKPVRTPLAAYEDYSNFVAFYLRSVRSGLWQPREELEVAAVRFSDGIAQEAFVTKVNPFEELVNNDYEGTGHENMGLPVFSSIMDSLNSFLGSGTVVTYELNSVSAVLSDYNQTIAASKRTFIDAFIEAGLRLHTSYGKIDKYTGQLVTAHSDNPDIQEFNLENFCEYFNFTVVDKDSALCCAYAIGRLFMKLVDMERTSPLW